jgi:hypothetical protein
MYAALLRRLLPYFDEHINLLKSRREIPRSSGERNLLFLRWLVIYIQLILLIVPAPWNACPVECRFAAPMRGIQ